MFYLNSFFTAPSVYRRITNHYCCHQFAAQLSFCSLSSVLATCSPSCCHLSNKRVLCFIGRAWVAVEGSSSPLKGSRPSLDDARLGLRCWAFVANDYKNIKKVMQTKASGPLFSCPCLLKRRRLGDHFFPFLKRFCNFGESEN